MSKKSPFKLWLNKRRIVVFTSDTAKVIRLPSPLTQLKNASMPTQQLHIAVFALPGNLLETHHFQLKQKSEDSNLAKKNSQQNAVLLKIIIFICI